jgi:hypothetical protein
LNGATSFEGNFIGDFVLHSFVIEQLYNNAFRFLCTKKINRWR